MKWSPSSIKILRTFDIPCPVYILGKEGPNEKNIIRYHFFLIKGREEKVKNFFFSGISQRNGKMTHRAKRAKSKHWSKKNILTKQQQLCICGQPGTQISSKLAAWMIHFLYHFEEF